MPDLNDFYAFKMTSSGGGSGGGKNNNSNGGTVSPTSKTVKFQEKYGELPTPTRPGYEFEGWVIQNKVINGNISTNSKSSPGI